MLACVDELDTKAKTCIRAKLVPPIALVPSNQLIWEEELVLFSVVALQGQGDDEIIARSIA